MERDPRIEPFVEVMERDGLPEAAIRSFVFHLDRFFRGERGLLREAEIDPVEALPDMEALPQPGAAAREALQRTAVLKLNGGLGTSMGLDRAKSLLPVRAGRSFLDLIARQVLALRERAGLPVPLLLMNSFRTEADSLEALSAWPGLAAGDLPLSFLQNRVPRILEEDLSPAPLRFPGDGAWCPPGHGDLYTALGTTGLLDRLLGEGFEYAFVSNADNLGAVLEPVILGHLVETGATFLMEAADRTPADRKGGHLCRLPDGRLALRETAQVAPGEEETFQDVTRHRHFNTNNLWIHLPTLHRLLAEHGGFLPLDTIVNRKTLDPADPGSPRVIQLETAMGAAVSLFPGASALRVPRSRFSPVKTTADLLAVRSDAYRLTEDGRVVLDPRREAPPRVELDPRFYRLLARFEERFPHGPPSLLWCTSFRVEGNVFFGPRVTARGRAEVLAGEEPASVPAGTVLEGTLRLSG